MAEWSKKKINASEINGGKEFKKGDRVARSVLNAMVNSGLYSQDQAELAKAISRNQPDTTDANVVGTPSVTILEAGTTGAKLKFSNIKGEKGDKGEQGIQGIQGLKGDKGDPNSLSIGSVTTGASGTNASATITGTTPNQVLNLVLPKGDTGATGPQPPLDQSLSTSTTSAPSSHFFKSVIDDFNTALNQKLKVYESGTDFVRYNDGVQICWGETSSISSSGSQGINLPRYFINATYGVVASIIYGGTDWSNACYINQKSSTSFYVYKYSSISAKITWIAVGRWK